MKKISKAEYHFLHCSKDVTSRIYGLPKIRKASVPLRLVVSFINSPTYNLSKFLSRILSSLLVNCCSVRNFKEFVDYVQNFTISESEILGFSFFDVVSLLISIPMDKALTSFQNFILLVNPYLCALSLAISDITIGLKHCFSSTVFSSKNSLFKQIFLHSYGLLHLSHYCFSLHGTCRTYSYYNISHPTISLAEICWRHVLHSHQTSYQWFSLTS